MRALMSKINRLICVLIGACPVFDREGDEYVQELRSRHDDSEAAVQRMEQNIVERHLLWGERGEEA